MEVWHVAGIEVASEVGIVAIGEVDLDRVVVVDGMKVAFAVHIVVGWVVDLVEKYIAAAGRIDCIGARTFDMGPQAALWD